MTPPIAVELKAKSRVSILVIVLVRPIIPSPNYLELVFLNRLTEYSSEELTIIKVKQVIRSTRWVFRKEMDSDHSAMAKIEITSHTPTTYHATYAMRAVSL
jgi:hypothetical protein